MRFGLFALIFFFCINSSFGQSESISDLKKQLDQATSDSSRVSIMVELADLFVRSGKTNQAKNIIDKAGNIADSLSNDYLIQSVDLALANYYLSTDQPSSAVTLLQESLDRYPESNRKMRVLNLLATAYRYQAKYHQSLKLYKQAKALVDSVRDPRTFGAINQNIAVVYENMGNMGAAFSAYQEGLEFAEASKDSVFLATLLNNLGDAYNHQENYKQAEYYLNRSIIICEALDFQVGLLRSLLNLANAKKGLSDNESALKLYNRALSLNKQTKPDTPPFRIIYNMGDLHLKMGKLAKAEEYFEESLKYSTELGITQGLYYNYSGLGNVAEQRGQWSQALSYYKQALDVAEDINSAHFRELVTQKLYNVYKEQQDFENALTYYEKYETISDSLRQMANEKDLAETENTISLKREEEINRLLREKQQQQEARITAQYWLIATGICIILVILTSMFLLYRSNNENKRINKKLSTQRNQLEELNKVKDKMLAIIAHDLRSPLASMQSMLYLVREDELSLEEIKSMTAELEVSLNQNISMMDNLLAWAQQQMSGLALEIETINARQVVEDVFENYSFQAEHKGIELTNKVSPTLKVQADFNLLKLILRNLVSNSIKFSSEGDQITVRTREESGKIVFEVADTGIGIPEEKKEKLFSVESRSRSGTQNEKGSGLGLRLCKEFVEKQHGEIHLESQEGKGTTFIFSLPEAS